MKLSKANNGAYNILGFYNYAFHHNSNSHVLKKNNKLAKLGDAIAISNLKLSMTNIKNSSLLEGALLLSPDKNSGIKNQNPNM